MSSEYLAARSFASLYKSRTAAMQRDIPPGTFVIQYTALDDISYAWVLSRTDFALQPLSVSRQTTEDWSRQVQTYVVRRNAGGLQGLLTLAYKGLAQAPRVRALRLAEQMRKLSGQIKALLGEEPAAAAEAGGEDDDATAPTGKEKTGRRQLATIFDKRNVHCYCGGGFSSPTSATFRYPALRMRFMTSISAP